MQLAKNASFAPTWDKFLILIGLLGLLFSSFLLVSNMETVPVQGGQAEAGSIQVHKIAQRRQTRSLVWETITGTRKVYWLDTIYVPPENTAELQILDNLISLEPDTMIQIDAVSRDRVEISLIDGRLRKNKETDTLRINGKRATTKRVVERAAPKPAAETRTWLDFPSDLSISDVRPFEEEWRNLNRRLDDLLRRNVARDELRHPKATLLTIDDPTHFELQLISPPPGIFSIKKGEPVVFRWGKYPMAGIRYRFEVMQSTQLQPAVYETTNSFYALPLQNGNFSWRVTVIYKNRDLTSQEGNFTLLRKSKNWIQEEEWSPSEEEQ